MMRRASFRNKKHKRKYGVITRPAKRNWEDWPMQTVKAAIFCLAAAVVINPAASFAASEFEGTWKVKDTAGKPFEITLSENAAAKASRGEGMSGTWKGEDSTAVITWNTGWITKIS